MSAPPPRPRLAFVVASEMTVRNGIAGHVRALADRYDVSVVVHTDDPLLLEHLGLPARLVPLQIERSVSLHADLRALAALVRLFRRERFDAVSSLTPKAGLLAMTAARLAGVPHRTHTFTGQVWATRTGAARALLRALDGLTHRNATFSLVDSPSQRDFLIHEGVLRPSTSGVLASGSLTGIDAERYRPDPEARAAVRAEWGLADEDVLFLQLGRITVDKGVLDLAHAFARVAPRVPHARLAFVGPDEEGLTGQVIAAAGTAAHAVRMDPRFTAEPERFLAAADVLCLPSYREGFGSVLLEAAAMGLPAMASRIYGVTDAVVDGVTGLLHEPRAIGEIAELIERLGRDANLRARLGAAGQARVFTKFTDAHIAEALLAFYAERLGDGGPREVRAR